MLRPKMPSFVPAALLIRRPRTRLHCPMESLINHMQQHVQVKDSTQGFLNEHLTKRIYRRNTVFALKSEEKKFWCYTLRGIAGAFFVDASGRERLQWACPEKNYFTGTKHPFSNQGFELEIRFLAHTEVLLLPYPAFRQAQKSFPDFSEYIHVLKQRKLEQLRVLLGILSIPTIDRFGAYYEKLPELAAVLPAQYARQLLQLRSETYYRGRKKYFGR